MHSFCQSKRDSKTNQLNISMTEIKIQLKQVPLRRLAPTINVAEGIAASLHIRD